jgi:hypothetical protein
MRAKDAMLKEMTAPESKYMGQVNNAVVGRIVSRTKSGLDVAGHRFTPYSAAYAKKKGRGSPDLVASGQMIQRGAFRFQTALYQDKVVLRIWMEGPHSGGISIPDLAMVHNFGMRSGRGMGFQMPKREFYGIDKEIEAAVREISVEHWRRLLASFK